MSFSLSYSFSKYLYLTLSHILKVRRYQRPIVIQNHIYNGGCRVDQLDPNKSWEKILPFENFDFYLVPIEAISRMTDCMTPG